MDFEYSSVRENCLGETIFRDSGIVGEMKGEQLGATVFLVPQEFQMQMIELLAKEKVDFSMREVTVREG